MLRYNGEKWKMYTILLLLCGVEAIHDIKTRTICPIIWIIASIGCVIWNVVQNEKDFWWIGMGMIVGIFLMICSKIFKGGIGMGDCIVFFTMGLGLGARETSCILFCSLVLCGIWALGQLLLKKVSRTKEIPFLPFVFLGMIWNCVMRWL